MTPEVSIVCITYNHIDYIRDALNGFVNQITSFPFEIIVYDDASTDGTTDVVIEYAERYPELIVPIIQKENQRQYKKSGWRDYAIPAARGEMVAICEGDDYWVDVNKLQRQYDVLKGSKEISLCIHNALVIDYAHDCSYLSEPVSSDREKTMEELIVEGGGLINPTASFFFRKELLGKRIGGAPVGDHFLLMDLATKGKVCWLAQPMSVYRFGSKSSWSQQFQNRSVDQAKRYCESYIKALRQVNTNTAGLYDEAIERRIQFQLDSCAHETLPKMFSNKEISFAELRRKAPSSKTIVRAIRARFFPLRTQTILKRERVLIKKKNDGTLITRSATEIPASFLPLTGHLK